MSNENNQQRGVGFLGLLTILFIGLKLTDHIDWSWWWVLAPIWVLPTIVVVLLVIYVVLLLVAKVVK